MMNTFLILKELAARIFGVLLISAWAASISFAQNASRIERKLDGIILPAVEMENLSLGEAVDQLRALSRENDGVETNPEWKGVRIGFEKARYDEPKRLITLSLKSAPLREVITAVCLAANRRCDVFADGVVLHVPPAGLDGMMTRSFQVEPDFIYYNSDEGEQAGSVDDPFAKTDDDPFAKSDEKRRKKRTARAVLEDVGVTFPEGASAVFMAPKSILIVRNTAENMDMVEAFTASLGLGRERQMIVRAELYSVERTKALELMKKYEGEPGAVRLLKGVQEIGKLVSVPSLVTRSGQRSKVESGELYEFVSGYKLEDGNEVPIENSVRIGTSLEVDITAGYEVVDLNIAFSYGRGEIKSEKQLIVTPKSGLEVEVEKVTFPFNQISTAATLMDGQSAFLGTLEENQASDQTLMLFVTVTSGFVEFSPALPE